MTGCTQIVGIDELSRLMTRNVMAHPQFADQGGPFQGSAGRISPESWKSPTPVERAALATLYTALITDYCLDLLGGSGNIVIDGRMTSNSTWLGTLASLRGAQRVTASDDIEGGMRGAAALAAWPRHLAAHTLRPCSPLPLPGLDAYRAMASRFARGRQVGEKLALNSVAALAWSFRGDSLEHTVKIVVRCKARKLPHALDAERRSREHLLGSLDT